MHLSGADHGRHAADRASAIAWNRQRCALSRDFRVQAIAEAPLDVAASVALHGKQQRAKFVRDAAAG
jgi:hypothetical protein